MKLRLIPVAILVLTATSGCGDTGHASQVAVQNGKVVLVKYGSLQDFSFVYGAFVITNVAPPVKTSTGGIVSVVTYEWAFETPSGRITGKEQAPDRMPIQFGEAEESPGVAVGWSYKSSGYLRSNILGSEHGSHNCVTELDHFLSTALSEVPCQYVEPPPRGWRP